jgi:cell cycle arrest protein BUB3
VAVGSIEGRAALEYLDSKVTGGEGCSNFAFKCHRTDTPTGPVAHPVNAIAFNKRYGTFVTGGGDGVTNVWDGMARKRVGKPTAPYPTSVSALAFSEDSDMLAVAVSYAFEAGDVEHPPDQIHIRSIQDAQILPRVPKTKK